MVIEDLKNKPWINKRTGMWISVEGNIYRNGVIRSAIVNVLSQGI